MTQRNCFSGIFRDSTRPANAKFGSLSNTEISHTNALQILFWFNVKKPYLFDPKHINNPFLLYCMGLPGNSLVQKVDVLQIWSRSYRWIANVIVIQNPSRRRVRNQQFCPTGLILASESLLWKCLIVRLVTMWHILLMSSSHFYLSSSR